MSKQHQNTSRWLEHAKIWTGGKPGDPQPPFGRLFYESIVEKELSKSII